VIPHLLDQFYWGERVRRVGVGPAPVARARLSAARFERALARCLGDESLRRRARSLAQELRDDDGIARAVSHLESIGAEA
jgi:UDP:flavonoid glycosyltransferase YjiC (YdhE family)